MRCCAVEVIFRSVYKTWEKGKLNEVITKVFNFLKIVLVLIIECDGGSELVETKRGNGFCNLDLTTEESDDINIDDYQNNINNKQIFFIRILINLEKTITKTIMMTILLF